ncbi:hypothetical protein VST7929_01596 [Vibrio stylophorae]|uniref:Uncharacterized protein n=1 Tax=Vibrio stylophorae TaxID=659351 RepID=A0ABN8DRE6_9VIBR|nr:hypothetical protein [Vibrio stylophorae]CAH0533721.1 hypothetical protein VST7929_01596 [Vibrio stylophorae]
MDLIENSVVCNYSDFLVAPLMSQQSFIEVLQGDQSAQADDAHLPARQRLYMRAKRQLSSRFSDGENLQRLLQLAQQEGITHMLIRMPYPLDAHELFELKRSQIAALDYADDAQEILTVDFRKV